MDVKQPQITPHLQTAESINHPAGIGSYNFTENKLLELGSDTQKLAAQTLNYIKQQVHSGERKKGVAMGRLQELERMIKHLQNEKLNLEAHLLTLGDKYGQD